MVAKAKQSKSKGIAEQLRSDEGRKCVFRIAKQIMKERQDVVKVNCLKDVRGNVVADEEVRKIWKEYMEKLFNTEIYWDRNVTCEIKEGPSCLVGEDEVRKVVQKMKNGKQPSH